MTHPQILNPLALPPLLAAVDETAVSACRQWLQQLQSFIMALQRDVDAFSMEAVRTRRIPPRSPPISSTSSMTATEASSGREGGGGSRLASTEDIMAVPSVSSWQEFVSSISSQFDATVEEIDRVEGMVRGKGEVV